MNANKLLKRSEILQLHVGSHTPEVFFYYFLNMLHLQT